jgi:SAM-dependent methyltransferase
MLKDQMDTIYRDFPAEDIPWNFEKPPHVLENLVKTGVVKPCRTIDLGCGTGNYALYLAGKGFDVTAIDISVYAIEIAKDTAKKRGASCNFCVADVLGDLDHLGSKYDFAYDWELLHHIFPENREKYLSNVTELLNPGGRYLSVCFSEDSEQFGGTGKYRETPLGTRLYFSSENEIQDLFASHFSIDSLKTIVVEGKFAPHKAIYALLTKNK